MQESLSRLRFRKVRSQASQAGRPKRVRAIRDSDALHFLAGTVAWVLGLWLIVPSGVIDWRTLVASGVTLVIIGIGGQMLLGVIRPREDGSRSMWLFMLSMMLLSMLDVRLAEWSLSQLFQLPMIGAVPPLCMSPYALVPLLVAILYGGLTALVIGLVSGVALALAADFSLGVFLISLCATAVAAYEVPRLRYRRQIVRALLRIALWQTAVVLVMSLGSPDTADFRVVGIRLATLYLWLAASGALAVLILPAAERMTGRISAFSLNPFADLGIALLQRMTLEAPGTYHHSMMVANLAQAAADSIGANGLLARIGAYYHDIGKLGRPQFYMENQMHGSNPHDDLPPNISRMIIVNHVKEGLVLARLNHLPGPVTRFIAVHHGTSVIRWFHHKAQSHVADLADENTSDAEESHYRYAGPLPVSREETIVALADSIEAAARAMPKMTPGHIENLVTSICTTKWSDGQLDQSLLSLVDLASVRKSFSFTLTHLLHARLAYPPHASNTDPKSAAPAPR